MTVSTVTSEILVQGNASTTTFNYGFLIPGANSSDQTNAQLIYTDSTGNVTTLAKSLWSITGVGNATGGTFTFILANNTPIAVGASLLLKRIVPYTQPYSIENQGGFYPAVVDSALDNIVLELQQILTQFQSVVAWMGNWAPSTVYEVGDFVIDGSAGNNTGNVYFCSIANTSSASWANDLAAGDWQLVLSYTQIASSAQLALAYLMHFGVVGTLSGSQVIGYHVVPRACTIPANFGATTGAVVFNSEATGTANATSSTVITVNRRSSPPATWTAIGTITFGAGGITPTFATTGGVAISLSADDMIQVIGPASADGTFASPTITIAATQQ